MACSLRYSFWIDALRMSVTHFVPLGLLLILSASAHGNEETFGVSSGVSAHWYNPERSGEGLVLEILGPESALIYWFTYDESGNQRWLLDVGSIHGNEIVFPELKITQGARFGPGFDPDDVETTIVGEAILSFSDCDTAQWNYSAFDQAQTLEMTRLTQTMAAGCQPINGVPGRPTKEYAGQSGSWYDPAHAGEGYTLHWLSNDQAVIVWFTYDSEGNQHWMLGTGNREDARIEFRSLHSTRGAKFGAAFDSSDVEQIDWGSLSLTLDCRAGGAVYASDLSGFGTGEVELTRLTHLARPDCPYQSPSLTDLYDLELREIDFRPLADTSTSVLRDLSISPMDIANDGAVVSTRGRVPVRYDIIEWSPATGEFTVHEGDFSSLDVWITPDNRLLTTGRREISGEHIWEPLQLGPQSLDWQALPGLGSGDDKLWGVSANGKWLVGPGRDEAGRNEPWIWSEAGGRQRLPTGEGMWAARPYDVADDGRSVVGQQVVTDSSTRRETASRWVDGGEPQLLRDAHGVVLGWAMSCSALCDVVTGSLHGGEADFNHPRAFEFWVWTEDNGHHYLGEVPGAFRSTIPPANLVWDTSADGSIFVGRYLKNLGFPSSRPVLWTQATGLLALDEVLAGIEGWDDNWDDLTARAVSPDGLKILLEGEYRHEPEQTLGRYARAQILTLIAKE